MKYMVMECHLSYAVVLDEEGRFLKVANRQYEVGQTVTDIVEMQIPQADVQKKKIGKWRYSIAAMAACFVLMITSVYQMEQMTYASVYMTINPEICIDVNRKDEVVGLNGINRDGDHLISDYDYKKKDLDQVMEELIDRAINMGYLHAGGQISLILDAESDEWIVSHEDTFTTHLNEYLNEKISVTIEVKDKNNQSNQVIIPVSPGGNVDHTLDDKNSESEILPEAKPEISNSDYNSSDYQVSDYDDGVTDYDESAGDNQSDYDSSEENIQMDDNVSDYYDDNLSNYEISDYDGNTSNDDDYSDYDD